MSDDTSSRPLEEDIRLTLERTKNSSEKSMRTVLLAVLLQDAWPRALNKQQIIQQIPFYGPSAYKALYRDLETLTGCFVDELPSPDDEHITEWAEQQQSLGKLAIAYDHEKSTFKMVRSFFHIDIHDEEARAFVALQEGFVPGAPYADAVQMLLQRWEWQFSDEGHQRVERKRKRVMRPVRLPLSPATDYSKHGDIILKLDAALEEGARISFSYTPLTQSWDDPPVEHKHLEPYELEYRDGHWYFTAYVPAIQQFLDYRVDRIHPDSFNRDDHSHFNPALQKKRPGVKISYWVAPEMARHGTLSARLREQTVTLLPDDKGAIVEGYARSIWWAAKLLLGYGDQVKAREPEELVSTMRTRVKNLYHLYMDEQ
jgi:Predicted transcriptional regulator